MPGRRTLDPYVVLGVARDATPLQVARAHRHLAKRHHPDLHEGAMDEAERMRTINEAWAILSNPSSRADYDRSHPTSAPPAGGHWGSLALADPPRVAVVDAHLGNLAGDGGRDAGRPADGPPARRGPGIPRTRRPPRPAPPEPTSETLAGPPFWRGR